MCYLCTLPMRGSYDLLLGAGCRGGASCGSGRVRALIEMESFIFSPWWHLCRTLYHTGFCGNCLACGGRERERKRATRNWSEELGRHNKTPTIGNNCTFSILLQLGQHGNIRRKPHAVCVICPAQVDKSGHWGIVTASNLHGVQSSYQNSVCP